MMALIFEESVVTTWVTMQPMNLVHLSQFKHVLFFMQSLFCLRGLRTISRCSRCCSGACEKITTSSRCTRTNSGAF